MEGPSIPFKAHPAILNFKGPGHMYKSKGQVTKFDIRFLNPFRFTPTSSPTVASPGRYGWPDAYVVAAARKAAQT